LQRRWGNAHGHLTKLCVPVGKGKMALEQAVSFTLS